MNAFTNVTHFIHNKIRVFYHFSYFALYCVNCRCYNDQIFSLLLLFSYIRMCKSRSIYYIDRNNRKNLLSLFCAHVDLNTFQHPAKELTLYIYWIQFSSGVLLYQNTLYASKNYSIRYTSFRLHFGIFNAIFLLLIVLHYFLLLLSRAEKNLPHRFTFFCTTHL